jgi:hypothetical protein
MSIAQTQDAVIHHSANAAAVTIPVLSAWLNAPVLLTVVTSILGIVWYCILIGEKVLAWKQRHDAQMSAIKASLKSIDSKLEP